MRINTRVLICLIFVFCIVSCKNVHAKEEINVKSFGATGNGINDDSYAIQKAIEYAYSIDGGIVVIPEGTYRIDSHMTLKNGVSLKGTNALFIANKKGIILSVKGNNSITGISFVGTLNTSTEVNKSLWQNRYKEQNDVLIAVYQANNVLFENCIIQNNYCEGIKSKDNQNLTIRNCTFLNLDCGYIAQGSYTKDIVVEQCYFDGHHYSESISIYTEIADNVKILNNTILNKPKAIGIYVGRRNDKNNYYTNVEIKNNILDNCAGGIQLSNVIGSELCSNTITNSDHGIKIINSSNISMINNIINVTINEGLNIIESTNITVQNNEFNNINYNNTNVNVTIPCIYINNSSYLNVQFNIFITKEKNKYALNLLENIDNLIYSSSDRTMLVYFANAKKITNSNIATQQGITGNFKSSVIDSSSYIIQYGNDNMKGKYNYKFHI